MKFLAIVFLAIAAGLAMPLAQEQATPSPGATDAFLSVELLQSRLKEIEDNADFDDITKQRLKERYQEAIDALGEAKKFRDRAEEYARVLRDGPAEADRIRSEIESLRDPEPDSVLPEGIDEDSSTEELETALAQAQADLAAVKSELAALKGNGTVAGQRTTNIAERRVAAEAELATVTRDLEAAATGEAQSPAELAEVARLQALQAKLMAEVEMLAEEDRTKEIRATATEVSRTLAELKLAAADERVKELQQLASEQLSGQVEEARDVLKRAEEVPGPPAVVEDLIQDLSGLIDETQKVREGYLKAESLRDVRESELSRIEEAFATVEQRLDIGMLNESRTHELREALGNLPTEQDIRQRLAETGSRLAEARNGHFELELAIRKWGQAQEVAEANGEVSDELAVLIQEMKDVRDKLRQDVRVGYRRWIGALDDLDRVEREIRAESGRFSAYAKEQLVLLRTSPMLGISTFRSLPEALLYCYGPSRVGELAKRLAAIPPSHWVGPAFVLVALLLLRPFFGRALRQAGINTRRTLSDRYSYTVVALMITVLLAAPAALAVLFLGLTLRQPPSSDWSYGLGEGLLALSLFLFGVGFLIALCRRGGLGEVHFRWEVATLKRIRRLTYWWLPAVVPAQLTLSLVMAQPGVPHLNGLGRMAGLVMVIGLGWVAALILHPEKGIAASSYRESPGFLFGRLRKLWFALPVIISLVTVGLLVSGYLFAGLLMTEQFLKSLTAVAAAIVIYGLILRWFAMRERRLALEERLAERRARVEAAQAAEEGSEESKEGEGGDEGRIPEIEEEEEMDLATVGEQTRRLLGFLVGIGLLWRLFTIWAEFDPIVNVLDEYRMFGALSIADVSITILVVAAIIATTRNLPGLLEMLVLRRLGLDAGTRTAMTTLAKYVVVIIGALYLFDKLEPDWSKFGWMAAALGVGIGFGLQEVVANFVCGIILLFERPVRVGDIVTVDGIDGVVSRIQIRATTITDWDRKEFIVPNKQFVTGTVLNWTLTNTLNRIVIVTGAAYGCDTEKALRILVDVARDHPLILDDPEPVGTFEEFSDSSLKFVLRCFLPSMDYRLRTISELHTEIDRRFKDAGIEIPFPQRDLHLKSLDPAIMEMVRGSLRSPSPEVEDLSGKTRVAASHRNPNASR